MRTKRGIIGIVLFSFTALLFFAPMMQQHLKLFKFQKLVGYNKPTEQPQFTLDRFKNSAFQSQTEKYLQENFGFREPLIRMYNQCTYDLFKTSSNNDVAIEKDGWLYHTESIYQYFGNMEKKFDLNSSQVRDILNEEARCLAKINAILKEYGVHFLTFTLPTKSYIYPEHLRWHPIGDTAFHAIEYYEELLESRGVPYINMTSWFKQLQDTTRFDLFYSKGSHWAAGATIAVDSILRYMEQLGDQHLTKIQLGEPYPIAEIPIDEKDLENLLNLARPLKHEPVFEYPVKLLTDDSTAYPSVWFIGTSFYWYMKRRVSFDVIFQSRDFTFYKVLYYTNREKDVMSMDNVDFLHELLLHDYVIFFRDGPQLHNYGYLFPGKALISLCISEERFKEKLDMITDSIGDRERALRLLQQNPEMFEELRGEGVPTCRNPKIESVLTERLLHKDRSWNFLLNAKAANDTANVGTLFSQEAFNILNHKPLLRNNTFFTSFDYFEFLLEETIAELRRHAEDPFNDNLLDELGLAELGARVQQHEFDNDSLMMAACTMDALVRRLGSEPAISSIRTKAAERHVSVDKMFREDVVWCFKGIDNRKQYTDGDAVVKAFERYLIERKIRINQEAMENVNQQRLNENLPFHAVINSKIEWIILNNNRF